MSLTFIIRKITAFCFTLSKEVKMKKMGHYIMKRIRTVFPHNKSFCGVLAVQGVGRKETERRRNEDEKMKASPNV